MSPLPYLKNQTLMVDNEVLTEVAVLAPSKRLKPSPNKQNMKRKAKERDLYKKNILSLLIGSDHQHKRSCGEISEFLTQLPIIELQPM